MPPRLFRAIVPVADIEAAARFYAHVLDMPGQRVSPGRHYFDCDGVILACVDPRADGDGYGPRPNPEPIYLAVDDLEITFRNVQQSGGRPPADDGAHHGPLGSIAVRPWGERSFYAADPWGNPLCFVERGTMFTG